MEPTDDDVLIRNLTRLCLAIDPALRPKVKRALRLIKARKRVNLELVRALRQPEGEERDALVWEMSVKYARVCEDTNTQLQDITREIKRHNGLSWRRFEYKRRC